MSVVMVTRSPYDRIQGHGRRKKQQERRSRASGKRLNQTEWSQPKARTGVRRSRHTQNAAATARSSLTALRSARLDLFIKHQMCQDHNDPKTLSQGSSSCTELIPQSTALQCLQHTAAGPPDGLWRAAAQLHRNSAQNEANTSVLGQ